MLCIASFYEGFESHTDEHNSLIQELLLYKFKTDLVGFYGISTIVVYLIPNPIYTYILKHIHDL